MPRAWDEYSVSAYDSLLSALTCVTPAHISVMSSTLVISPMPDFTALSLLFSSAQIMNIKPHAPAKTRDDTSSNAYVSLMCVA